MPKQVLSNEIFDRWNKRIANKEIQMKDAAIRKGWDRFKGYYRGDYKEQLKLKIPVVRINEVYAFVRTSVSELFARSPKFKVNPRRKKDIIPAAIAEQVINYFWSNKDTKRQIKKAIKEGKIVGYSWVKAGYEVDIAEYGGIEENTNEYIEKEDLYAIHVKHDDVWYDDDALDPPHDCRWMIHWYLQPTELLRKKYKNKQIQASSKVETKKEVDDSDIDRTWVGQIWDKDTNKVYTYVDGLDNFAEEKKWPDGYFGFPFVMLNFDEYVNLDGKDNLPDSEVAAFEDQVLEKMKLRSMEMEHLKRFNRQIAIDEGKVAEDQRESLKKGEIANVLMTQGNPNEAVGTIPYPPIQTDAYAVENRIDMDRDKINGLNSMAMGGSGASKSGTLGELEMISQGTAGRLAEQQQIVEDFCAAISRKIIQLTRTHFTGERYARITGEIDPVMLKILNGKELIDGLSLKYSKEDIKGEYDIDIVAGSTLPVNPMNRLKNLIQISRFGPAFGLAPGSLASMYLGKSIMREMELRDVELAFDKDVMLALAPKEPDPEKILKVQKLQQDIQRGATDNELKKTRIAGNTLSNVKKAGDNAKMLSGEEETQANAMPGMQK